mgnify:CR=1 FL=1
MSDPPWFPAVTVIRTVAIVQRNRTRSSVYEMNGLPVMAFIAVIWRIKTKNSIRNTKVEECPEIVTCYMCFGLISNPYRIGAGSNLRDYNL